MKGRVKDGRKEMFEKIDLAVLGAAQFFINTLYDWVGINKYFLAGTVWFLGLGVYLFLLWKFGSGIFSAGELIVGTIGPSLVWFFLFFVGSALASILKRGENQDDEVLDYQSELVLSICANARCIWFLLGLIVFVSSSSVFDMSPRYFTGVVLAGMTVIWCSFIFYIFSCTTPPRKKSKVRRSIEFINSLRFPRLAPVPTPA